MSATQQLQLLDSAAGCTCIQQALVTPAGEIVVLRVIGEVDLATAPILQSALDSSLDQQPAHLIVDLTAMSSCSIQGVDLLAAGADRAADLGIGFATSGIQHRLERFWTAVDYDLPSRHTTTVAAVVAAIHASIPSHHPLLDAS